MFSIKQIIYTPKYPEKIKPKNPANYQDIDLKNLNDRLSFLPVYKLHLQASVFQVIKFAYPTIFLHFIYQKKQKTMMGSELLVNSQSFNIPNLLNTS